MEISSIIAVLVLVFGILGLVGIIVIAALVFKLNIQYANMTASLAKTEASLLNIDKEVHALNAMTMDPLAEMGGQFITGNSIQDLMEKLNNTPNVDPEDVERMKKLFQDMLDNENNRDDDEDPDTKWK